MGYKFKLNAQEIPHLKVTFEQRLENAEGGSDLIKEGSAEEKALGRVSKECKFLLWKLTSVFQPQHGGQWLEQNEKGKEL